PIARLDEAPKIHREVNRVAHQPGRKTDRERAQPLRASVVDAVPWRFIAVAGRGGITEELELPASLCWLDRDGRFPGEVGDVIRLGYGLGWRWGDSGRLDQSGER